MGKVSKPLEIESSKKTVEKIINKIITTYQNIGWNIGWKKTILGKARILSGPM